MSIRLGVQFVTILGDNNDATVVCRQLGFSDQG